MCTVIEKYNHKKSSYYVFDIGRYPNEPDSKLIRSVCREYNCQNLNGMLVGPYRDDAGYHFKAYDTNGSLTEPSITGMIIFNKYLTDKNYTSEINNSDHFSDDHTVQTGSVMLL